MKKTLLLLLTLCSLNGHAQKRVMNFEDTQARLLDILCNGYVKPLTVELKVDETKGRIIDEWILPKERVENDMNGEIANVRSWGIYMSSKKHNADVIVAPTFNLKTEENSGNYKLTVVGYPATFINWRTATENDYEWIRMEKTQTTSDLSKISAIVK